MRADPRTVVQSGDGIRVVHPLFQGEGDGAIPISPLQLHVDRVSPELAARLNEAWHSRLPKIDNYKNCIAYGAVFANHFYAVALWSDPVARLLNGRGWFELRRMAIAADAPKNTGSRMLKIMRLLLAKERPDVTRLISYQDVGVHLGTIYKAAGWTVETKPRFRSWTSPSRARPDEQSKTAKQRWGIGLHN